MVSCPLRPHIKVRSDVDMRHAVIQSLPHRGAETTIILMVTGADNILVFWNNIVTDTAVKN